jgi:5-methylthioribose kinase
VRVTPLGWGVSNAVFRVETADRLFVLKQSRPQLKTRETWLSDLDRVYREQEVMEFLHPLLPPLTVPEVLFVDRPNYVFAMSHAPLEARVWKESLLAGEVDLGIGERAGLVLGRIHEATASDLPGAERFRDPTVFVQLRIDPFYRRIQERLPDVADAVAPLIDQMLSVKEALCHGDFSPKNILTHAAGFTLVDYETAHLGDPTMDLGFFLSHLLLKAVRRAPERDRYFELTRAFWRGYEAEVRFRPAAALRARGIGHLAVCLLARVDGTSPVDYLPEEPRREAVRRLGRALLRDRPAAWEDVLSLAEIELRHL